MSYGTGAIMAVPAHDTRDYEFAKVFDLPIIEVVKGGDVTKEAFTDCATGTMVNSGFLDGMSVEDAKVKIKGWLEATGKGKSRSTISCGTGYSLGSGIGANRFRLFTATSAAGLDCRRANCR